MSSILATMPTYGIVLLAVGSFLVGLIIGFILTRFLFKRYMKKHPPINENMIRAMMSQMGRTPSEKQVRSVMKSIKDQQ